MVVKTFEAVQQHPRHPRSAHQILEDQVQAFLKEHPGIKIVGLAQSESGTLASSAIHATLIYNPGTFSDSGGE